MSNHGAQGSGQALGKPKSLGERIRFTRIKWDWSQQRLAEAVGTTQKSISNWEKDIVPPSGPALTILALLFGVPEEALKTGHGFHPKESPFRFRKVEVTPENLDEVMARVAKSCDEGYRVVLLLEDMD